MEAIRKIVTVKGNVLEIVLPDSYDGKEVQRIILPLENASAQVSEPQADYENLYGSFKIRPFSRRNRPAA